MSLIATPPDVSVLNCGAGDMTFSFNKQDPLEVARAERVVQDMLARGYLLFAKVDGQLVRIKAFDAKTHEYVIADGAAVAPSPYDPAEPLAATTPPESARKPYPGTKPDGRRTRRVKAAGTPVTGIAPTAGG